jgi:malonyl-CoA decarboxylase
MQFQRNGYALLFCSRSLFARNLSTVRTSSIFETARFLTDFKASGDANTLYDSGVSNNVLNAVTNGNNLREALSGMDGGIVCAMKLRKMAMKRKDKALDKSLRDYLQVAFSRDSLNFKQVTFEESHGVMLERVAENDSVLTKIRTLRELKRRLGNGRRCYALLHPQLPDDPVAFIHVALTQDLAPGIQYLDRHCSSHSEPQFAMFYSVNSPHAALGGLDMATRIIKLAAADITHDYPSIHTFSTLSPIPGFNQWLGKVAEGTITDVILPQEIVEGFSNATPKTPLQVLSYVHYVITNDYEWWKNNDIKDSIRPAVEWLGRCYLAKQSARGMPYDPVARFHLRNGASLHRLNWLGNNSLIGMSKSAGLMVNYMYSMDLVEERALAFPHIHVNEAFWHTSGVGEV